MRTSESDTLDLSSVTISFFMHSTEDQQRLLATIKSVLGLLDEEIQTEKLEGHFRNEIVSAKAHVTGSRAREVSRVLLGNLSETSRKNLAQELDRSVDEHEALHLRIDRQSLHGSLELSDVEPIKVKIKPRMRIGGRNSMIQRYRELISK